MSIRLLLPCVRFQVEVQAYPENEPTPLEKAALLFLAADHVGGPPTAGELAEFLCVGKAVTNDLLYQLWYRGWVQFDASSGRISVRKFAGERIARDFEDMATPNPPEILNLVYELIGGQIGALSGENSLQDAGSPAYTYPKTRDGVEGGVDGPFEMPLEGFLNAGQSELIEALTGHPYYKSHLKQVDLNGVKCQIRQPTERLRPAHVKYYGVYFDVYRDGADRIALEVNDTRPINRQLGRNLCDRIVAILDIAPRLKQMLASASTPRRLDDQDEPRALRAFVHQTHQDCASALADDRIVSSDVAAAKWKDARDHLIELVSRRVDLAHSRALQDGEAVRGALAAALAEPARQVVIASPRIRHEVLIDESTARGRGTSVLSLLERKREIGTVFVQTSEQSDNSSFAALENLIARENFRFSQRSTQGAHTRAAVAVFDQRDILLASESMLDHTDAMGLHIRFAGEDNLPGLSTKALLERLQGDFGSSEELPRMAVGDAKEQGRQVKLPPELAALVDSLDDEFSEGEDDDEKSWRSTEDDSDPASAEATLALHRLRMKERHEKAEALLNWVSVASDAAEILIDAEIHDQVVSIVRETGPDEPLAIGISSPEDLRDNALLMATLRKRLLRPGIGPVFLCLPGDPKLAGLVDGIREDVRGLGQVTVQFGRKNARWGFAFVISPRECVLATNGLARRVVNVGRGRRGTELGLGLHGVELRDLAMRALAGTHEMSAVRAAFGAAREKTRPPAPALSELLAAWQAASDPLYDGNLGASIVADQLRRDTRIPWRPDDEALVEFFDAGFRHAILKAAAAERREGASELLARMHWQRGDLLHCAILADDLPETFLRDPELRQMAFVIATGGDYAGALPQSVADAPEYVHRREFMLMTALLMLEGRADQLAAWLAPGAGFLLSDDPLERLVAALAVRALDQPASPVDLPLISEADDLPAFGDIWDRIGKLLTTWRSTYEDGSSKRALRDYLYRHTGSMTGQLANLILDAKHASEDSRIKAFDRLRAAHSNLFGDDPDHAHILIDRSRRVRVAQDYFERSVKAAPLTFGVNYMTSNYQIRVYSGNVSELFRLLYELYRARKFAQPAQVQDRRVLHAAAAWLASTAQHGNAGTNGTHPLAPALRRRLTDPFPRFPLLTPTWALPLVEIGGDPDWAGIRAAALRMEFPADPTGLRRVMELLMDGVCAAFLAAKDRLPPAWFIAWRMLDRCLGMPAELKYRAELDSILRDFRAMLFGISVNLREEIDRLRRRKNRNDLLSPAFDGLFARLKALMSTIDRAHESDAPLPDCSVMEALLMAMDGAKDLAREYAVAFGAAERQLLDSVADSPGGNERRVHLHALCELDRLDVARWYIDKAPELVPDFGRPISDSRHQSAFLAAQHAIRHQSAIPSTLRRLFKTLPAGTESPFDLLTMFSTLGFSEGDAKALRPSADALFSKLAEFFGTSLSDRERPEENDFWFRLTTSDPKLISLAPYLAYDDHGRKRLTLFVPKGSREMKRLLDAHSGAHSESWRTRLFGQDHPVNLDKEDESMRGFQALHGQLSGPAATDVEVPLLISAFGDDRTDRAPILTHLEIINLLSLNLVDRRHVAARQLVRVLTAGSLKSWWHGPDLELGSVEHDRHKMDVVERLLELPWSDLEDEASTPLDMARVLAKAADRLDIRLSGTSRADERSSESDVYSLSCLVYFSGGNLLNALDLLFSALKETRRGRRYLDVTPVLGRLRPDRGLGQRLLLRGLPPSLIGSPPNWGPAKLLLEALILATPGTREGGDYLVFDPAAVQDILTGETQAAPLRENWLQIALGSNLIEQRDNQYRVNSSNGLISLLRMI